MEFACSSPVCSGFLPQSDSKLTLYNNEDLTAPLSKDKAKKKNQLTGVLHLITPWVLNLLQTVCPRTKAVTGPIKHQLPFTIALFTLPPFGEAKCLSKRCSLEDPDLMPGLPEADCCNFQKAAMWELEGPTEAVKFNHNILIVAPCVRLGTTVNYGSQLQQHEWFTIEMKNWWGKLPLIIFCLMPQP